MSDLCPVCGKLSPGGTPHVYHVRGPGGKPIPKALPGANIIAVIVLVAVLGGIIAGAIYLFSPSSGSESISSPGSIYCDALGQMGTTFRGIQQGTLTGAEQVTQLTNEESQLRKAALAYGVYSTVTTLADAVGRLKVAAAKGFGSGVALRGLTVALENSPRCA